MSTVTIRDTLVTQNGEIRRQTARTDERYNVQVSGGI
jgi:hypothetical protein